MRYCVIINPRQFQDNAEDTRGFMWCGDATDEGEAFDFACADCETVNGWDEGDCDRDTTDVIESGPDYRHQAETLAPILADLLAYEREAFEQDTPLDLADLCTAFGALRVRLKRAMGLELAGVEQSYPEEG